MITLVLEMIRARRGQALTVVALAALAVAAAVGAPVYLQAVDRAVVATEVDNATADQLTVAYNAVDQRAADFAASLIELPGFTNVYAVRMPSLGPGGLSWLVAQQDVCAHLTVTAGRCLMGPHEIVVGERAAGRLGLGPGDVLDLAPARYDDQSSSYVPSGPPTALVVAGVYRPTDPGALYWGRTPHFRPGPENPLTEPFFAALSTFELVPHTFEIRAVSAVPEPGAFTVESLAGLRATDARFAAQLRLGTQAGSYGSDLATVLDRIDRGRALARQVVPIAAVPMVALCWFVLFLAVAHGTHARRHELGLVALRGARLPARWWLTGGETVVVILAGAPLGYLLGHLAVRLAASVRLGSVDGTGLGLAPLPYAAAAVAGALLAGGLALRTALASSVVDLLRRVPAPAGGWRSVAFDVAAVVVTAVAIAQLRTPGGRLGGVSLLVPALVAASAAVLLSRLLRPLAGRFGRYALRRGRVGTALGALQLGRHPGSQRVFVLLSVALAGVGFAAGAVDVAGRAIADQALVSTGAPRVLELSTVESGRLLTAVRRVDPEGRFAMAVAVLPGDGESPALAVDATRLATVAEWRRDFGPVGPADLAARLRPPAPEPYVVRGDRFAVDVEATPVTGDSGAPVALYATLRPLDGAPAQIAYLGRLAVGRSSYGAEVACVAGCRLAGLEIRYADTEWHEVALVLRGLGGPGAWRGDSGATLGAAGDGVRVAASSVGRYRGSFLIPADFPLPVPVAATRELPSQYKMAGLDGVARSVAQVDRPALLPGLGDDGILLDLEYADRAAIGGIALAEPQVWLGRGAPADAADRLRAEGLLVVADRRIEDRRAVLQRDAPAVALWYHLVAAGFSVLLAVGGIVLVAVVERGHRLADLRALRGQGLSRRAVRVAARWGQLSVVAAALPCGILAAVGSWAAVGNALPLLPTGAVLAPPRWPSVASMSVPLVVTGIGFAVVAAVAGSVLGRASESGERRRRRRRRGGLGASESGERRRRRRRRGGLSSAGRSGRER